MLGKILEVVKNTAVALETDEVKDSFEEKIQIIEELVSFRNI